MRTLAAPAALAAVVIAPAMLVPTQALACHHYRYWHYRTPQRCELARLRSDIAKPHVEARRQPSNWITRLPPDIEKYNRWLKEE